MWRRFHSSGVAIQAKTLDELMVRVKEVIQLCLEDEEGAIYEEGVRAELKPRIIGIQRIVV
jgi:predicted RNase H-like HicB family nuclease